MQPKDYIEIIVGLCAIIGYIWSIAETKYKILEQIDSLKDFHGDRINDLASRFELQLVETQKVREMFSYKLDTQGKRLARKISRVEKGYWEIGRYLAKNSSFQLRHGDEDGDNDGD